MSYMKFLFVLVQLGTAKLQMYVNKPEAKCTLRIVCCSLVFCSLL